MSESKEELEALLEEVDDCIGSQTYNPDDDFMIPTNHPPPRPPRPPPSPAIVPRRNPPTSQLQMPSMPPPPPRQPPPPPRRQEPEQRKRPRVSDPELRAPRPNRVGGMVFLERDGGGDRDQRPPARARGGGMNGDASEPVAVAAAAAAGVSVVPTGFVPRDDFAIDWSDYPHDEYWPGDPIIDEDWSFWRYYAQSKKQGILNPVFDKVITMFNENYGRMEPFELCHDIQKIYNEEIRKDLSDLSVVNMRDAKPQIGPPWPARQIWNYPHKTLVQRVLVVDTLTTFMTTMKTLTDNGLYEVDADAMNNDDEKMGDAESIRGGEDDTASVSSSSSSSSGGGGFRRKDKKKKAIKKKVHDANAKLFILFSKECKWWLEKAQSMNNNALIGLS